MNGALDMLVMDSGNPNHTQPINKIICCWSWAGMVACSYRASDDDDYDERNGGIMVMLVLVAFIMPG